LSKATKFQFDGLRRDGFGHRGRRRNKGLARIRLCAQYLHLNRWDYGRVVVGAAIRVI
jgi:hypothetical protein